MSAALRLVEVDADPELLDFRAVPQQQVGERKVGRSPSRSHPHQAGNARMTLRSHWSRN